MLKQFVDFKTYNADNPFGAIDPVLYPQTKHHIGCDFKVPIGTPIYAPEDGEMFTSIMSSAKGYSGTFIFKISCCQHKGEWGLELCHLKEFPKKGQYKRGDIIAYSGNTGSATTGPHLHAVLHKDAKVTKNYNELTSESAFFNLRDSGRLVDVYKWFNEHC